jgi:hypothetical protein
VLRVELAALPVKVGPALIEALAPVEIVMSLGSSSSVPVRPSGARVSTLPSKAERVLARDLDEPAVAAGGAAAGRDAAGETGRVGRPRRRPLPPSPLSRGVGDERRAGAHFGGPGVGHSGFAP